MSNTIIQIMNVYECDDTNIFMRCERLIVPFNEAIAESFDWLLMFSCKGIYAIYSVFYLFLSILLVS